MTDTEPKKSTCAVCHLPTVHTTYGIVHEGGGTIVQRCNACHWVGGQMGGYQACPACHDATALVNDHAAR